MLELHHLLVRVGHEVLDHVLFAQPVAAPNRVVEVMLQAVVRLRDRGRAAFGRHRVAAHRIDLGNQRHRERRIRLGHRDRRAQTRAAGTDDRYIGLEDFQHRSFLAQKVSLCVARGVNGISKR